MLDDGGRGMPQVGVSEWGGKEEGAILETFEAEPVDKESWEYRTDDINEQASSRRPHAAVLAALHLNRRRHEEQAECQCSRRYGYFYGRGSGREYGCAEGGSRSQFGPRSCLHGRCHGGDGPRSTWIQGQEN